jgi:hypothetical protein
MEKESFHSRGRRKEKIKRTGPRKSKNLFI